MQIPFPMATGQLYQNEWYLGYFLNEALNKKPSFTMRVVKSATSGIVPVRLSPLGTQPVTFLWFLSFGHAKEKKEVVCIGYNCNLSYISSSVVLNA